MALDRRYRYGKLLRLRRRREFLAVQKYGKRRRGRYLVVITSDKDQEMIRLGVTVSRKVGPAVVRNRVKRLIREAFRLQQHELPSSLDVVVVAKRNARYATFSEIEEELYATVCSMTGQQRDPV